MALDREAVFAADADAAFLACVSCVNGIWHYSLDLVEAVEVLAEDPPGRTVYETERRRFVIRPTDGLDGLAAATGSEAGLRVRVTDALLQHVQVPGGYPVRMGITTPYAEGPAGQERMTAAMEAPVLRSPSPASLHVVGREAISRGVGAYLDWTLDDAGETIADRLRDNTVVVDVGLHETTIVVVSREAGGQPALVEAHSTTLRVGYLPLLTQLEQGLRVAHGSASVRATVLHSILMTECYRFRGVAHDVSECLEEAGSELSSALQDALRSRLDASTELVVTGPAANLVARLLSTAELSPKVPVAPGYANARGLAKALLPVEADA